MKVLFLSVSTGGGHLKAAKALEEYISKVDSTSKTLVVDTLNYASPVMSKIIISTYINMLKLTPSVYGKIYHASDANSRLMGEKLNFLGSKINSLFSSKIYKLVEDFRPDIVVCTHPFSLQMVSRLDVPTIAVLTDYATHPLWVKGCVDAYVIPHEFLIDDALNKGIELQKIYPFGIPVEEKFLNTLVKKDVLNEFGLKDKLTFLIMGGSLGLGSIENVFLRLVDSKKDFQIVVISGSNQKLKHKLGKLLKGIHKDVTILDYTDDINKLMEVADFIITKPGGLTVAESLIKRLPICIISPIPGQEEKNSSFLVNCGAALRFRKDDDIDSFLNQIINNEIRIESMKEIASILAKPDVCKNIYNLMCKLVVQNKLERGVNSDFSHSDRIFYTNEKI